jgi:osmotically-inducible protein OsmY
VPPPNDAEPSVDASAVVGASASAAAPGTEAQPASDQAADDQLIAQVRSSIASLAPGGNIDVKATGGIVALAGSVPSQNALEEARQAAQQVAGVKQVDTSALTVSNQ